MISTNYKMWYTIDDSKRCVPCENEHGRVYHRTEEITPDIPLHLWCRCFITWLQSVAAGMATMLGKDGADWWLKHYHKLPPYYITKGEAKKCGWIKKKGNLHAVCPGKMIGGDIYYNSDGHLPMKTGRIWYEADVDYQHGKRGLERILYSNDGLVFVSYDHYHTFVEVV